MDSGFTNVWVLPSDLTAARLARDHIVEVCGNLPTAKLEVARLLVTELVANALLHGSGTVVLVIARDDGGVRVDVADESPDMPVLVEPQPLMEYGAGMRLVSGMADRWGVDPCGDGQSGKRVWFELV